MGQAALLRSRRFAPYFWTQFLGAFNDNAFKNALVILFAFGGAESGLAPDVLVNLAGGLFVLPFFLCSAIAGQLADKYEKARIIRAVKLFEIAIMGLGAIGFALRSVGILLVALFLMGTHSALFGPVKFSILPQHLRDEELMEGNALVEMGTFVAILLGTVMGGLVVTIDGGGPGAAAALTIGLAVVGYVVSRGVPRAPADDPRLHIRWNPAVETRRLVGYARRTRSVWHAVIGISWFWFYGALVLAQFPRLGRDVLGGDEAVVTLLLTLFSIGVGLGCVACGRLAGGVIDLRLAALGAAGLTCFALDLAWAVAAAGGTEPLDVHAFLASARHWRVGLDLALLGASGGFFIVPLLAFVQHRSDPRRRARIIAANNVVSAFFMVVAAGAGVALVANGVGLPQIFVLTAVVNALVAFGLLASARRAVAGSRTGS